MIYDGHPKDQLPVIIPLLLNGLRDGRKCLYLGDPEMVGIVNSALVKAGVDVAHEVSRQALVLSSDRSHLDAGAFDPAAMVSMLCGLIDEAVRDGFNGLCATGDMRWELGSDANFERLLEYEALLEQVFRDKPLVGICQYHRGSVPSKALRDALLTHRSLYVGEDLNRDNLFYIPPELLLKTQDRIDGDVGQWMCDQITRILEAERQRDKALEELRRSEAEQRRLAEQLATFNQDLERRVKERTSELEYANRELESFSASVSHDLRAPLRAIQGFGKMLAEDQGKALNEEGQRRLGIMIDSAVRMDELI